MVKLETYLDEREVLETIKEKNTFLRDIKMYFKRYILKKGPENYEDLTSREKVKKLNLNSTLHFLSEKDYQEYYSKNSNFPIGPCYVKQDNGKWRYYNDIPAYLLGERNN